MSTTYWERFICALRINRWPVSLESGRTPRNSRVQSLLGAGAGVLLPQGNLG